MHEIDEKSIQYFVLKLWSRRENNIKNDLKERGRELRSSGSSGRLSGCCKHGNELQVPYNMKIA
jgi:hypothetical protein